MTDNEIKAAGKILKLLGPDTKWKWKRTVFNEINDQNISEERMHTIANFLKEDGLLEIKNSSTGNPGYELTPKAVKLLSNQKGYGDYIKEEKEKEAKQQEKEKLDEYYRTLQVEDLVKKLNAINPSQLDFWKSQKQKNIQTTLIAIISALLSLVTLMKTFGLFG